MADSPILFPVRLEDGKILVLDETLLPFKEDYIEVTDLEQALRVLEGMKTRAFGQVLLFFYSCVLFNQFSIEEIVSLFNKSRPTFDFALLGDILKNESGGLSCVADAVDKFIGAFDAMRRNRVRRLAALLPSNANILTICNVNGELIYLYEELLCLGKKCTFYVSETRPYLQGTRLTFWELRRNNIPSFLICDNQAAELIRRGDINCVVTGADRSSTQGGIINKIGTYALACLAKHFRIPFYALIQYPKDIDINSVIIEERRGSEVFMFLEGDYSRIESIYPSFDVVPSDVVTNTIELKNGT